MPSLALVMIARDEARCIARCLLSAAAHVDEMWVLDTGSVDDTPAIDTDPPDTVETVDTPVIPSPPTSWGAGLVDISGPLLSTDAFEVSVGSREQRFEPDTISTAWTDLDGDHTPEVVLTTRTWSTPRATDFRVYRWMNGEIVRAPDLEARLPQLHSSLLLTVDLDTDGLPELVQANAEALGLQGL